MNPRYRLNQWVWLSLDWLFPPECGGCSRAGFRWCPECQQQVQSIAEPMCQICGLPMHNPGKCASCKAVIPPFKIMRSWLVFEGPIRQALHTLKYRRNMALGEALAKHLAGYVATLGWPVEAVVPIPLGKERMKERGYNQTGLVAMPLAAIQHWHYIPKALTRCRETKTQVGLSVAERKKNVKGAFQAETILVRGKNFLLMDDVATTGATIAAGAAALMDAGARSVYGLTLARALFTHQSLNNV